MYLYKALIGIVLSFVIVVLFMSEAAYAQYDPPEEVTLTMYQLSSIGASTGFLCTRGDESYGCTADDEEPIKPYPFEDSTITIGIEGTDGPDNDVYRYTYLNDVIAQEMSPSSFLQPALDAQAIAARTYAYWHIKTDAIQPGAINNSTEYQVFLPYRYDAFGATERTAIDAAVADRYYMSYKEAYSVNLYGEPLNLSVDDPIFAEFSADVPERTVDSPTFVYIKGVEDRISSHPDVPTDGNSRGLIQGGAGRWARGSTSFRCEPAPAPCKPPPSVPHSAWSVRWENAFQILIHYYTGIHIRDANDNNRIVTPNRRWVPLQLFGQETPDEPRLLCKNSRGGFAVEVQNTGIFNWEANAFELSYRTDWQPVAGQAPTATSYLPPVLAGDSTTTLVTIPVPDDVAEGTYTIPLEMRKRTESGDYEWFSDDGWPGYPVNVMVVEDCSQVYLPLVQAEPSTVPSALFPD